MSRAGHLMLPVFADGLDTNSPQSSFGVPDSLIDGVGVLARPSVTFARAGANPSLNIAWRVGNLLLVAQAQRVTFAPTPIDAQVEHLLSQVSESDLIKVAESMNAGAATITEARP
jgi:hypothetical protein